MKANAIIRIIIYCIVICLLCGLLTAALGHGRFVFSLGTNRDMTEGNGSVDAASVKNLEIEWASGDIIIETADCDTISFQQSGHEDEPMAYSLEGDTLILCYSNDSIQIGFVSLPKKTLTVTVPKSWECENLKMETVSTDATIRGLTLQSVELEGASMDYSFDDCTLGTVNIDGASNRITIHGQVDEIDCDGAANKISGTLQKAPESINLDGVSIDLDISLPSDCGFRVTMSGVSTKFSSDFQTTRDDDTYIYGNGHCDIDADGVSINITLKENKQ